MTGIQHIAYSDPASRSISQTCLSPALIEINVRLAAFGDSADAFKVQPQLRSPDAKVVVMAYVHPRRLAHENSNWVVRAIGPWFRLVGRSVLPWRLRKG